MIVSGRQSPYTYLIVLVLRPLQHISEAQVRYCCQLINLTHRLYIKVIVISMHRLWSFDKAREANEDRGSVSVERLTKPTIRGG